jgi:hypothetical protein
MQKVTPSKPYFHFARRPGDALLYEDETIIRLFPPLRSCWGLRGAQVAFRASKIIIVMVVT